jgi:hypothetical protein
MGEVDQLENAVDQGIAQGNETVERADRQTVDQLLDKYSQKCLLSLSYRAL